MIGDSTMANKIPERYPETGWGMVFQSYFKDNVEVINRARNGLSTKSFMRNNRWQPILDTLQQGDYVIIEFGHNDSKIDQPNIGTSPTEYKINLLKYINDTRSKKAIPILMTPVTRRNFNSDGSLGGNHKGYLEIVYEVVREEKVAFVDMYEKSRELLIAYKAEPSKKLFLYADSGVYEGYPNGVKDNTHFNKEGAHKMAELAIAGLKEINSPLIKFLKK